MTDSEKLNQLYFLTKKALITIDNEKQELYSSGQDYLQERNEIRNKLYVIGKMFLPEDAFYPFNNLTHKQYDDLIKILKSLLSNKAKGE